MDFVDIRLLWGEGNMLANFVADISKQLVIDKALDDCMFVADIAVRIVGARRGSGLVHTAAIVRSHWYIRRAR